MRIKYIYIFLIINYSFINNYSFSQQKLTVDSAIAIALKNNYSINISKRQAEIATNNNTPGNAGFLPQIGINATGTTTGSDIKQKYASGLEVNKSGVNSKLINAGVSLNWTLFDGLKMFTTHEKLKELQDMGDINSKIAIETIVSDILNSYYDIVKQEKLLKVISDEINISEEKLRITELKYNLGAGSNLDYLQAKTDLNAFKSAFLKQQIIVSNSKITLNDLLSRANDQDFDVVDTIPIIYKPSLEDLKTSVVQQNNILKITQKNIDLSKYYIKEVESQRYPKIGFIMNYNFARTQNQAGFSLLNQNLGLTTGLNASMNLFDGFNNNVRYKNAKVTLAISELQYKDVKSQIESDLLKAFRIFENNLQLLALEEENIKVASENLKVAMEKYKLGSISALLLKDAQTSYENAQNRLVNARYDTKISEIKLMKLNGSLVY
jgi:outer membrane protein